MLVANQGRSSAMGGVREAIGRHGFPLQSFEDLTTAVLLISKEERIASIDVFFARLR